MARRSDVLAPTATCPCRPAARMARGRPKLLLGVLLGPCVWLAPTGAQLITQCTDINVGAAYLSEHRAFGGPQFCCTEFKPGDGSAPVLCCPGDGSTGRSASPSCGGLAARMATCLAFHPWREGWVCHLHWPHRPPRPLDCAGCGARCGHDGSGAASFGAPAVSGDGELVALRHHR